MTKLTSTVFFIWSIFFVFHKEALCKDNVKSTEHHKEIKDGPFIKKFSDNEILGLGIFEAPEEKIFDMLPGETFYFPREELDEPGVLSTQLKEESNM